jgi:hypothetical protein
VIADVNVTSVILTIGTLRAGGVTDRAHRHVTTDGDHRTSAFADDPRQPSALFITDLAYAYACCHRGSLTVTHARIPVSTGRHATTRQTSTARHQTLTVPFLEPFAFMAVGSAP